ncbi:hypothetical protein GCM10028803_49390 [Larkinella knui]|uniref:T9SS C-terminal target domain-containing protein n=1 Tax=Larkinella knui TaxID=2025310 RepID=A0A3P1CQK2_9BACT|nr:hypothetical protein [Larkinella knui]RRB15511.1 hypothetical protein EHT87_13375 [Larkinella knui]
MKTIVHQVLMTLFLGLIVPVSNAQVTGIRDPNAENNAFEVNMFLGTQEKINLMLAVRQPRKATIRLKDANNEVLYQESLSKVPANHWRKFDFEGMKTGVYYLEISNGKQKTVRQIEVGMLPAVQSQRFITYAK